MRMGIIICILLGGFFAKAQEVLELPEEELARESVTPTFDRMVSTKNRNILTEGRWEVNGFYGWALTEPIYNANKLGLSLYYHTNETSAWGLTYGKFMSGLTSYANQLNAEYQLDFSRAPAPEYMLMMDYNINALYGKMSLSKDTVINTQLFGSASAGMVKYQNKAYPGIALGIGEKFYFTKNWALRLDLRLYVNQAPIPFKGATGGSNTSVNTGYAAPDFSEFEERVTYTSVLDVGLSYLF